MHKKKPPHIPRVIVYDIESLSNIFLLTALDTQTKNIITFECSPRENDWARLRKFLRWIKNNNVPMVGFNNLGFDYPLLHALLPFSNRTSAKQIVTKAAAMTDLIINKTSYDDRFKNRVHPKHVRFKQIDLMALNHFDNIAKATSLKMLQFVMRMDNIIEYDLDKFNMTKVDELIDYNVHDVKSTYRFYKECVAQISFRNVLSERYKYDMVNFNDTKIGEWVLVKALEGRLGEEACYFMEKGKRHIRQTPRSEIKFRKLILPYIKFDRPEFQVIYKWIRKQVIHGTKETFNDIPLEDIDELSNYVDHIKQSRKYKTEIIKNLHCVADGFKFVFGTGGIHGSTDPHAFYSDDNNMVIDCDVTSLYPSIAIVNNFFPQHLTKEFCHVYKDLLYERMRHDKGTPENAMLKLALNGAYGKSNSKYSPLFDPQFTMSITVNGQLLLLMLCEKLMEIPELKMIQVNTDGITVQIPRKKKKQYQKICKDWEDLTKLKLEYAIYTSMFVRDVNNYIAVYENGKVKRKGAYEYKRDWHQNQSAMIIPKAAEALLLRNYQPTSFINNNITSFDYCLRTKVPRSSKLYGEDEFGAKRFLQNLTRYYVSKDGVRLKKIMPPTVKKPDAYRYISIEKGYNVTEVNDISKFDHATIDRNYYLTKIRELTDPIEGVRKNWGKRKDNYNE